MAKIRTVSDTKRDFYKYHTRPINSVYNRVVEELIVEMHLLSVNVDFRPDPIYFVGVCQSFEQFMNGYTPESDKDSIFQALCQSVGGDPDEYRNRSSMLLELAKQKSSSELINWLLSPANDSDSEVIAKSWAESLAKDNFKYSRLFAIGLYSILVASDETSVQEEEKLIQLLAPLTEKLKLPVEKLKKDWDLYRSNLEKMSQILSVLEDTLKASKQKRTEPEVVEPEEQSENGAEE